MRLQKYMAKCGVASRRKSEEIILQRRVKVNGKIIDELGTIINPAKDMVEVDGRAIKLENKKVYILLNKPEGVVTTVNDQFNRPTVLDFVKGIDERIYPVGRLDYDTSGFLLLTNDGDLAYKLTHPKHEIMKKYIAKIEGIPSDKELNMFRNGLDIGRYITSKAKIRIVSKNDNDSIVEIQIHEGKNRQIRRMCEKINHPVIKLKRIAMGKLKLGNLSKGKWRYLTDKEINYLKNL